MFRLKFLFSVKKQKKPFGPKKIDTCTFSTQSSPDTKDKKHKKKERETEMTYKKINSSKMSVKTNIETKDKER